MLFVDELDRVDGGRRAIEDELRLLDDLPDSDAAVAAARANCPFADTGVDAGDPILVAEPRKVKMVNFQPLLNRGHRSRVA